MEKICQIKAGNFFLGVNASAILNTQELSSFLADEQGDETPLILLASLFDTHNAVFPESEGFVVEVKSTAGSQMLVIDSFSEKAVTPYHFESLPQLYPDLTRICCPQIMIHEGQPVLLLDIDGLETVLASQETVFAVVSLATLREHYSEEKEMQDTQSAAELDDTTFNVIVSWTIAEFIKRGNDEDYRITPDESLLESIPFRHLPDVNNDLLQGLINKTIQKCSKFHNTAMQRLRQKSALIKS